MSSSPQVVAKQTGIVKNSPLQGTHRYINIKKRKSSTQKAYNTEKESKSNETDSLKNIRFALLDNENSTEKHLIRHPKPPLIILREASSNIIVKILNVLHFAKRLNKVWKKSVTIAVEIILPTTAVVPFIKSYEKG